MNMQVLLRLLISTQVAALKLFLADDSEKVIDPEIQIQRVSHASRSQENEFGELQWGLLIDGKDASKGPHAYDHHGFEQALQSLDFVLKKTGDGNLTMGLVNDMHTSCCRTLADSDYRAIGDAPLSDKACSCFGGMDCQAREDIVSTIPKSFLTIVGTEEGYAYDGWVEVDKHGSKCAVPCAVPRMMAEGEDIEPMLIMILDEYNEASTLARQADKKQQILTLAKFLRKFAWLHPFSDGNGRFRTLLLQREIRRHKIAPGAFMYNNNRDVFFITDEVYAAKIQEGIEMANLALQTRTNPWNTQEHVAAHLRNFPAPSCSLDEKKQESDPLWGSVSYGKKISSPA